LRFEHDEPLVRDIMRLVFRSAFRWTQKSIAIIGNRQFP